MRPTKKRDVLKLSHRQLKRLQCAWCGQRLSVVRQLGCCAIEHKSRLYCNQHGNGRLGSHAAVDALFDAEAEARGKVMPHWFDVLTPAERDECLENIRHAVKAIAHGEGFGCLEEVLELWRLVAAKTTLLTEED